MTTEAWKIERYQALVFEVRRIHQVDVVVVPLVIGDLGRVVVLINDKFHLNF